ncbi:DUF853 family protein [Candidatus Woesearchaeota archaeon]|nr:DUF853 family protein [Candidatus Woesearchaeota archaeon]
MKKMKPGYAFIGYEKKSGKDTEVYFPLSNLTKHFIALGSSGSGKTVLSKVLIEEIALNSIPSIAIDPQGDIASLAISSSPDEIKKHMLDESILRQFNENTHVTVFTPISTKGVPLCLNPLKMGDFDAPSEEVIPLLQNISRSITRLLGYIPTNDKGKAAEAVLFQIIKDSYDKRANIGTFSDLADMIETMDSSIKEIIEPFISNEKELELLVRKIRFLTVGEKELLFNLGVSPDIDLLLGRTGKGSIRKTQVSVIYLNTLASQEEKEFFVSMLTTRLYQWMLKNPSDTLNCAYLIDEIAPFIPAGSEKPIPKPILKLMFKQARKYGVACIIATQNPGDIDYKAFAQFGSWAIGRLTVKQDQKKVEKALRSISSIDISTMLPKLKPGSFMLFSPDISEKIIELKVRWLYTTHKTLTEEDIKKITSQKTRELYKQFMSKKMPGQGTKKDDANKTKENMTADTSDSWEAEGSGIMQTGQIASEEDSSLGAKEEGGFGTGEDSGLAKPDKQGKERHFMLKVTESRMMEIIQKKRKKHFMIGPYKEDIASFKLALHPLYLLTVSISKNQFLGRTKNMNIQVIADARTGELILCRDENFEKFAEFSRLLDISESEIRILRYLTEKRKKLFTAQIAIKTDISNATVAKSLKFLLKKGLAAFEKTGKETRYYSLLDTRVLRIEQAESQIPELTYKKLQATVQKETIKIKDIERSIKSWFSDTIVVNHELIYLPVYAIRYHGNSGSREIEISGITGKEIPY